LEEKSETNIYNVLQLRIHQSIKALKAKFDNTPGDKKHEVVLSYITSRGKWYDYSWKGAIEKSGGVPTNIGIHFFDMLMWIFGKPQRTELHVNDPKKMAGFIELENANVRWFLSVDKKDLPMEAVKEGKPTYRSITVDGEEIEFSGGFTDLHTVVYRNILDGKGFGLQDARPSIELVHDIRHSTVQTERTDRFHPFVVK
jgi:UDP-N-acetyl-2-amino-2-deoxyglucuronate dehydrogenase